MSAMVAGGGLKMGQAIGDSARGNDVPASDPVSTPNLLATVMHTLFDVGTVRITRGVPATVTRLIEAAQPIPGLL